MSSKFIGPTFPEVKARFEFGCLLASFLVLITGIIDVLFSILGSQTFLQQAGLGKKFLFLSGSMTGVLIISAIPYGLGFLISRKRSLMALILLIVFDLIEFLVFIGSAQDNGIFAYPALRSLMPAVIIAISLFMLRRTED